MTSMVTGRHLTQSGSVGAFTLILLPTVIELTFNPFPRIKTDSTAFLGKLGAFSMPRKAVDMILQSTTETLYTIIFTNKAKMMYNVQ